MAPGRAAPSNNSATAGRTRSGTDRGRCRSPSRRHAGRDHDAAINLDHDPGRRATPRRGCGRRVALVARRLEPDLVNAVPLTTSLVRGERVRRWRADALPQYWGRSGRILPLLGDSTRGERARDSRISARFTSTSWPERARARGLRERARHPRRRVRRIESRPESSPSGRSADRAITSENSAGPPYFVRHIQFSSRHRRDSGPMRSPPSARGTTRRCHPDRGGRSAGRYHDGSAVACDH